MSNETKTTKFQQFKNTMKGSWLWGVLLFALLLFIDQATKLAADAYFSSEGAPKSIAIIPGWIELCQHYNKGVAFSGLNDAAPWVKILLIIGTAALMAMFAVFYFKMDKRRSFLRLALVLVVAGGVGNLIDRLYFKMWQPNAPFGVRDMVMVDLQIFDFGICNFADFFISAGAVMLVLAIAFFDTDAFIPLGKYKALAEELEKTNKAKKNEKSATEQAEQPTETTRANHTIVWRDAETETAEPTEPTEENQTTDEGNVENNG